MHCAKSRLFWASCPWYCCDSSGVAELLLFGQGGGAGVVYCAPLQHPRKGTYIPVVFVQPSGAIQINLLYSLHVGDPSEPFGPNMVPLAHLVRPQYDRGNVATGPLGPASMRQGICSHICALFVRSEAETPSKSLAAWGHTIAKSMGKVKAEYRQMTARHTAGNRHMWYVIAVKGLERSKLLSYLNVAYPLFCLVLCCVVMGISRL